MFARSEPGSRLLWLHALGALHELKFASTVSNLSVTTEVISSIHAKSPVVVSCTVDLSSSISDDVMVNITWNKDDHQLHNNSEMLIVSASLTSNKYQSNLTIHVLEDSDDGLYSCSAGIISRSSNQLISKEISSIYLNVEGMSHHVMVMAEVCLQAQP